MRKLVVVLMIAVSFALGMVSQNLNAGNSIYPSVGSSTFSLNPTQNKFSNPNGKMFYKIPNGWKVGKLKSCLGALVKVT